jgi:hypothetical protein
VNTSIATAGEPEAEVGYRSPPRCLILAFRKSRDRWKKKAQQRNHAFKLLKVRMRDLERSRQQHRAQAQQTRLELAQAQQTIDQLQVERQQLRQRDETRQTLEKKVRR